MGNLGSCLPPSFPIGYENLLALLNLARRTPDAHAHLTRCGFHIGKHRVGFRHYSAVVVDEPGFISHHASIYAYT